MGSKTAPGIYDCMAKAAPEEPCFVLRGQDMLAPDLVRSWAEKARENGCPEEKVAEALALADQMEKWPHRKMPD